MRCSPPSYSRPRHGEHGRVGRKEGGGAYGRGGRGARAPYRWERGGVQRGASRMYASVGSFRGQGGLPEGVGSTRGHGGRTATASRRLGCRSRHGKRLRRQALFCRGSSSHGMGVFALGMPSPSRVPQACPRGGGWAQPAGQTWRCRARWKGSLDASSRGCIVAHCRDVTQPPFPCPRPRAAPP